MNLPNSEQSDAPVVVSFFSGRAETFLQSSVGGKKTIFLAFDLGFILLAAVSFGLLAGAGCQNKPEITKIILQPPSEEIQQAELYLSKTSRKHRAVLVLCPSLNGNGKSLVEDPLWRQFATENQLALVGLSFTSNKYQLRDGRGYYYASQGSGDLLLAGIEKALGATELPLLLYGYSGGAQFVSRFVEWKPERVISWCAYSASWWARPQFHKINPPGIVACGEFDADCLGASLEFFKKGRAKGKPWTWVSVSQTGRKQSLKLKEFVQQYFAIQLKQDKWSSKEGCWVDIGTEEQIDLSELSLNPALGAWLPSVELMNSWSNTHEQ